MVLVPIYNSVQNEPCCMCACMQAEDSGYICGVEGNWICCRVGFESVIELVVPNFFCLAGDAEKVSSRRISYIYNLAFINTINLIHACSKNG